MVKLAIFDMDGTLLNTLADLAEACNHALRKGGFPVHTEDEYKNFVGRGPMHLIERALPEERRDSATVQKTRGDFSEYYEEHSLDSTKPYDGVDYAMKTAREAGVSIAVLSNKPDEYAVSLSEIFFPGLIDLPAGSKQGVPLKPDPSAGLEIMRHFGVSPEETVYIGDSGVDMQTGKRLGAYTVGVTWGFRPKNELQECGADVIIDNVEELIKILVDK